MLDKNETNPVFPKPVGSFSSMYIIINHNKVHFQSVFDKVLIMCCNIMVQQQCTVMWLHLYLSISYIQIIGHNTAILSSTIDILTEMYIWESVVSEQF